LPLADRFVSGPSGEVGPEPPDGELAQQLEVVRRGRMIGKMLGHPPVEPGQAFLPGGEQTDCDERSADMVSSRPVRELVEVGG
jgi:hypothetical protein